MSFAPFHSFSCLLGDNDHTWEKGAATDVDLGNNDIRKGPRQLFPRRDPTTNFRGKTSEFPKLKKSWSNFILAYYSSFMTYHLWGITRCHPASGPLMYCICVCVVFKNMYSVILNLNNSTFLSIANFMLAAMILLQEQRIQRCINRQITWHQHSHHRHSIFENLCRHNIFWLCTRFKYM